MTVPRPLVFLGKLALVAAVAAPPTAIWLSGRFGGTDPALERGAPGPRATVPRSGAAATPMPSAPPTPDLPPTPAPSVTVGAGAVTVPPPAPGAAAVPTPRAGQLVGEPRGLPDPNQTEASPR